MGYQLGVDLGTTYTAAAIARGGRVEILSLGDHSPEIASVLFLRPDGTLLVGEAALRKGVTEPVRMAREFKRRLGDHTALMLGGTPLSAEALTARLLRSVVDEAIERQGEPPERLVITRPANWGPFRQELLQQAVRLADVGTADVVTEPEAAAIHFASTERVEVGDTVAVYDLGGGTFDAAILRKSATGFELLGTPEGIEHLGGLELDQAVLGHVLRSVGDAMRDLDQDDPRTIAGLARLRRECTEAKEALSTDSETDIPVALPGLETTVRLTRAEFEDMVRPLLQETVACMRRAMVSAKVTATDLRYVVLVGGSARVPLVAEMLGHDLGRPVTVSPQPKHSVALGAAMRAGGVDVEATRPAISAQDEAVEPTRPARASSLPVKPNEPVRVPSRAPGPRQTPASTNAITRGQVLGVAGVLVALMFVLAFVSPGFHDVESTTSGLASLDGDWLTEDGRRRLVNADFDQPLEVLASGNPTTVRIELTVLGREVASAVDRFDPPTPSEPGLSRATLDLRDRELWIAGPLRGTLVIDQGQSGAHTFDLVLAPSTSWTKTVPGWLVVALTLFLIAYAESLLRPLLKRGRTRLADRVGMIAVGALAGAAVIAASWSMAKTLLSPVEFAGVLIAGGALGACITKLAEIRRANSLRGVR